MPPTPAEKKQQYAIRMSRFVWVWSAPFDRQLADFGRFICWLLKRKSTSSFAHVGSHAAEKGGMQRPWAWWKSAGASVSPRCISVQTLIPTGRLAWGSSRSLSMWRSDITWYFCALQKITGGIFAEIEFNPNRTSVSFKFKEGIP